MSQTRKYSAEDGLKVLAYLGLTRITDEEKAVFRKEWGKFYKTHNGDLIQTTWELYAEALPFTCGDRDRGSFALEQLRDSDFGKRLETTKLDEELKKGTPLEEILKKGPHKFIIQVKVKA